MFIFAKKWNPLVLMPLYFLKVGTKVFYRKTLRPGTLTGKIGNIHHLWFSSVKVKTFKVTILWANTNFMAEILDWNSNFKAHFQSFDLSFTLILQMDNDFNSINYYVTIKNNDYVLCRIVSYLERLSYRNIFCSLHKTRGLKMVFEIGISILCFQRRMQQVSLRPLNCVVECFSCNRWKSHKRWIISILPVNNLQPCVMVLMFITLWTSHSSTTVCC